MGMTAERRNEIAYLLLKRRLQREGIKLSDSMRREIGQAAKEVEISPDELKQFFLELLPELIGNALGFGRVGLTTGSPVAEPV